MIIDSHCHLNILDANQVGTTAQVIAQAEELGVEKMMCIAIGPDAWQDIMTLADQYDSVFASIGVHPCCGPEVQVSDEQLLAALAHPKVLAVGEVGLDYFHQSPKTVDLSYQHQRFRQHIRIAKQLNKPLVIHTRASTSDLLEILREEGAEQVGGIMHCFVEDLVTAQHAMAMGFYISFSGILTFKNATALHDVAKAIPLDRILVETDAPYLAPVPYRGKTNQPGYTRYVVEQLAHLRGEAFETIAEATSANFARLFRLEC